MIRALAPEEIERVLRAEVVGRIGCHAEGRTYVVPVAYVYDEGAIYAHSRDGMKVHMMRQNPAVCFEVDHVEDLLNWDSAICWGTFQELDGAEAERGLNLLRERLRQRMPRLSEHGTLAAEETDGPSPPVVFRVNLTETSGREERLYWELLPIAPHADGLHAQAEQWLSHDWARQLADMSAVLEIDDVWEAADKIAEHRPAEQVVASLTYQGTDPDMAHRLVGFLLERRDRQAVA
ncbi:MAG TPA: pyridoxamine 5'-phosphate oxidase family protein [Chloroflexota bacterium]